MSRYLLPCLLFLLWTAVTVHCRISCQDRSGCSDRGECVLGVCQCETGSTGGNCETVLCYEQGTSSCGNGALAIAACRALNTSGMPLPPSCLTLLNPGPPGCNLPTNRSCQEIHRCFPSAPSGNYQIQLSNGSAMEVYCDMEGNNCGGEGGWTRVAYVNMTETGATCPQGLIQRNLSGLILCGINTIGCQGTVFLTLGINYTQVCGQLRGFQLGSTDGFSRSIDTPSVTIDDQYLDGASITYGSSPRRHIWSYAAAVTASTTDRFGCPCNNGSTVSTPSFVGNDYYCESAATSFPGNTFLPNDPLWDGQQCTGLEGPCCTNPNLPWFNKTLNATTNEDIELRLCQDEAVNTESVPLQVIELFIR